MRGEVTVSCTIMMYMPSYFGLNCIYIYMFIYIWMCVFLSGSNVKLAFSTFSQVAVLNPPITYFRRITDRNISQ